VPRPDAIGIRRVAAGENGEDGALVCRVCGRTWTTSPETDAILAEVFAHHDDHLTGSAPSSATPDISTR
jgi:hypothetical protein